MAEFLEGKALIDAVRAKLAERGCSVTEDEEAAAKLADELFDKYWKLCSNDGELRWDHAQTGAVLECASLVLQLQKRIEELER